MSFPVKSFLAPYTKTDFYVGFSGGADSTALLLTCKPIIKNLIAIHFHHGIRENEADADAEWCQRFCESEGIDFLQIKLDVPGSAKPGESTEAAARRLRLEAWRQLLAERKTKQPQVIALAHHQDDRIENLLLRLMRGSNVSGLTSLRPAQELDGLLIVRPLLNVSRSEIEVFLTEQGVSDWCTDSSNRDNAIRRNFVRNQLLPELESVNPGARAGLLQALTVLDADADFLENMAKDAYKRLGNAELNISRLTQLHPAIRSRVLRLWLTQELGQDYVPRHHFMDRLNETLSHLQTTGSGEKSIIPLSSGYQVVIQKDSINLTTCHAEDSAREPVEWNWREQPDLEYAGTALNASVHPKEDVDPTCDSEGRVVYFDCEQLSLTLQVRIWQAGDSMALFGKNSTVKLKKLFTDRKIRSDQRNNYPCLVSPEGDILWVAAVRRSNIAPVTSQTTTVVKLSVSS